MAHHYGDMAGGRMESKSSRLPEIYLIFKGEDGGPMFTVRRWYFDREQSVLESDISDHTLLQLQEHYPTLVPKQYQVSCSN